MYHRLLIALVLLFSLTACNFTETEPESDQDVTVKPSDEKDITVVTSPIYDTVPTAGTWTYTENEFVSTAVIKDGTVVVEFGTAANKLVFWRGTFDAAEMKGGDKVVSIADESLKTTLAGSQEKQLTFVYDDKGTLTYELSLQGASKPVPLQK